MKRSVVILVFISLLILRFVTKENAVFVEGEKVKVSIPTVDYTERNGNQTLIKRGDWEVRAIGYTDFIPGKMVIVEGVVVSPFVIEGVVVGVEEGKVSLIDRLLIGISTVRHWATGKLQRLLPEPHASLAIGILLGVKREMPRDFYDALVATGTLHVVAASGYNVSVVSGIVSAGLTQFVGKQVGLFLGIISVAGYVLIAGSSASVVRAGVMGSLTLMGIMLGRMRQAKWLLWVTAWIMLMIKPSLSADIGFQLSMAATVGLLYLSPMFLRLSNHQYLVNNLYPTLAATISTAPIILWHFGRLSLIGVLVNMLILPVVPLIMLLATLTVLISPVSYLLYVPLWWMVLVISCFGS